MANRISAYFVVFFLLSGTAAHAERGGVNTLEYFTRSLTNIYTALESCRDASIHGTGKSADTIREFLSGYYPEGIPYWVLPTETDHIEDQNTCDFMVHDRMLAYQQASAEFVKYYPKERVPPTFILTRSKYNNKFIDYSVDTQSLGLVPSGTRSRELVF